MGRLPTLPRKSLATGRLKKAKPKVAPHKAKLTTIAAGSLVAQFFLVNLTWLSDSSDGALRN